MYIITAVRYSQYGGVNRYHKGAFNLHFETLDKLASFIHQYGLRNIYFPHLKDELTKREYKILLNKCMSLR